MDYIKLAFDRFDKMHPGEELEIGSSDRHADWIEAGKLYIDSGKWNYELSSDYSRFKRLSIDLDKIYEQEKIIKQEALK